MLSRMCALVLPLLLSALPLFAQGVDTGSLRGIVTDGTGAALPGVTVTAASEAVMGGSLTAVTSSEGLYRFPSLPPGRYTLKLELTGFQPIELEDVRINVGLALTIDRQMEVSSVSETLTVVGESPIVDTKNTSAEVNWTGELKETLPSARDLWSTLQQVPGLVMAKENVGGIESPFLSFFSVHGSIRGSHQYNFNGMDMSDMHSGIGLGYFNTDSFEEMQFSTSGISAEHSRGGLVMNTVTKSGGNRFSGQGAFYYEGNDAAVEQHRRRPARPRRHLRRAARLSVRRHRQLRRPDQARQDLVLRRRPPLRGHPEGAQLHAARRQRLRRRRDACRTSPAR